MGDRRGLLPPGDWAPNDFKVGDRIVVEGYGSCEVVHRNDLHYGDLMLLVAPDSGGPVARVWPNLQWVGYEQWGGDDE